MPRAAAPLLRFPTPYLRLLAEQLQRRGADVAAWQARHGLDTPSIQGAWVDLPPARFAAAVSDAVMACGEPALGLLLGERLAAGTHGIVGHAVLHSTTLGQALDVVIRYAALRMPILGFEATRDATHWQLHLRPLHPLGAAERPLMEATLLAVHRLLGTLLLGASPVDAIRLPHALGRDGPLARALFACDLLPPAPPATLRIPLKHLDAWLPASDPEAFAIAERQCRDEMARRDTATELSARVRALLQGPLLASADAAVCARLLALSPRSLERRLAAEGTGFRSLVDDLRRERAEAVLDGGGTVDAAAAATGYGDVANFRRAFRRWTGMSPSAWRDRASRQNAD